MLDGIERTDLGKLIEYLGCLRIGMISVSFASIFTSTIRQKSRNGERITFVVPLPLDELEKFRKTFHRIALTSQEVDNTPASSSANKGNKILITIIVSENNNT